MVSFQSYASQFYQLLNHVVADDFLHAKWLNTLSYMENCGARLIAACEHPTKVKSEMLKHAAEEFRHAYYLKQQMKKICTAELPNYQRHLLLGETQSLHYLKALNLYVCRYLKEKKRNIPELSYLLVTYAIERRAHDLYPVYQETLEKYHSPVSVKSILREEEHHLAEIEEELVKVEDYVSMSNEVCEFESRFCKTWIDALLTNLFTKI